MKLTLEFYDIQDKKPDSSDDHYFHFLVKRKGFNHFDYAYYDFEKGIWNEAITCHEYYDMVELNDVELWALIPSLEDTKQ